MAYSGKTVQPLIVERAQKKRRKKEKKLCTDTRHAKSEHELYHRCSLEIKGKVTHIFDIAG